MLYYPTAKLWAPDKLANCVLWLDANDLSTITTVSGAVSSWNSKIGNFQAVQNIGANRPLLAQYLQNRNSVFFNGTNSFLSIDAASFGASFLSTNFTIAISANFARLSPGVQGLITKRTAATNGIIIAQTATTNNVVFDWGGSANRIASANPVIDTNTTYIVSRSSRNRRLTRNGSIASGSAGAANPNTTSNLFIGCTETQVSFLQGAINEIIMYQSALSDANLSKLAGYLHWKWLNPEVMPASNPYKETVPKTIN